MTFSPSRLIGIFLPVTVITILAVESFFLSADLFKSPIYVSLFFTSTLIGISLDMDYSEVRVGIKRKKLLHYWPWFLSFAGFIILALMNIKDNAMERVLFCYCALMQLWLVFVVAYLAGYFFEERNKILFFMLVIFFTSFINSLQVPGYSAGLNVFGSFYFLPYYMSKSGIHFNTVWTTIIQWALIAFLGRLLVVKSALSGREGKQTNF